MNFSIYLNRRVFIMMLAKLLFSILSLKTAYSNRSNLISFYTAVLSTSFRKLFFCLAHYIEEVNLPTFVLIICKTICHNYLCKKKFYSSHWFLRNQIFSLLPIVKMNVNYAEISKVGNLEAAFQQVPPSIFLKVSQ